MKIAKEVLDMLHLPLDAPFVFITNLLFLEIKFIKVLYAPKEIFQHEKLVFAKNS